MIQKVFAINSVCFNLLIKPDGQSLRHKNNSATERRLLRLTAHVPEEKSDILNKIRSAFSFTSPKGRRDLFKTPVYVWECSSAMHEALLARNTPLNNSTRILACLTRLTLCFCYDFTCRPSTMPYLYPHPFETQLLGVVFEIQPYQMWLSHWWLSRYVISRFWWLRSMLHVSRWEWPNAGLPWTNQ